MTGELAYLSPEDEARIEIDRMLTTAGWSVQHARQVNLRAARGVADGETKFGVGDYVVDRVEPPPDTRRRVRFG